MKVFTLVTMAICTFLMFITAIISKTFLIGVAVAALIVLANLSGVLQVHISYWFAIGAVVIPAVSMLVTWVLAAVVTMCGAVLGVTSSK